MMSDPITHQGSVTFHNTSFISMYRSDSMGKLWAAPQIKNQITQTKVVQQITGNPKQTQESEIYGRQYLNILIKFFG